MGQLSNFFLQLGQLTLLGFEQFFRSRNTFNLILLFPALEVIKFPLVDLNELIHVMQFLFDEFKLLVKIRRCIFIALRKFGLIEYFIYCLSKFIEFVSVLLVLKFEGNYHFLIVLLTFPFLSNELSGGIDLFR